MMELKTSDPTGKWSISDLRRAFKDAAPLDPADLIGRWDGELIGRPYIQRGMRLITSLLPFRGWIGKEFVDEEHMHNLVLRHGVERAVLPGTVFVGDSLLDKGSRTLVITYPDVPPPTRWMRAELRWLSVGDAVLGMLMIPVAGRPIGPFPYRLVRPAVADRATLRP